jgi:NTP pyrophosphatase (non-canonical NTP hydrolase)
MNKQGVRDLNGPATRAKAALAREAPPAFGKHEMPPELASQILEHPRRPGITIMPGEDAAEAKARYDRLSRFLSTGHSASRMGPAELFAARTEMLTILAEECAEVTQACTKILRFGPGLNPYTERWNQAALEDELGQVIASALVLAKYGGLDAAKVERAVERRLADLRRNEGGRLQHASADGVEA